MGEQPRRMANELPRGRLFLSFKSINNGDERELGLEMLLSGRGQPTGLCQSQGEKQALGPPTTSVPSLQLNLARQQCSGISNEGVDQLLCNCFTSCPTSLFWKETRGTFF